MGQRKQQRPGAGAVHQAVGVASFDETWQTINDTFYDRTFGGVNWAAVRAELRLHVQIANSPDEARRVIANTLDGSTPEEKADYGVIKEKIRADLKRFIGKTTSRRPLIMPVILEI